MKPHLTILVLLALLAACQSPVVSTRKFALSTEFIADNQNYKLKQEYTCHLEDVSWISERGESWHIREGNDRVRILAQLNDGTSVQILPYFPPSHFFDYFRNTFDPCNEKNTGAIQVRLFLQKEEGLLESFDQIRSTSTTHELKVIDSKLALVGKGMDSFAPMEDKFQQPNEKHRPFLATRRYYSVWVSTYDYESWHDKTELSDKINARAITWLENNQTYPYTGESGNDEIFSSYETENTRYIGDPNSHSSKLPLVSNGNDWIDPTKEQAAIQWMPEPIPTDYAEKPAEILPPKFRRWVHYQGASIELPILEYNKRTFYDPVGKRLIQFSTQHVNLR